MDLFEHLHRRGRDYDAIFFFGATDPTTVEGLPLVPERSVLVPDLVGRPATSVPAVIFYLPRAIGFWTEAERDEIHRAFANEHVPHEILERRDPSEAGFGSALEALVLVAASHG